MKSAQALSNSLRADPGTLLAFVPDGIWHKKTEIFGLFEMDLPGDQARISAERRLMPKINTCFLGVLRSIRWKRFLWFEITTLQSLFD
jgi:hypothetical protein